MCIAEIGMCVLFFFKEKTAYEMRINDWSSDVCSSGLFLRLQNVEVSYSFGDSGWLKRIGLDNLRLFVNGTNLLFWSDLPDDREEIGRASCRARVSQYV